MKYNDIITNGTETRRILGITNEIVFISETDLTQIAYYDLLSNIEASYTVVVPPPAPAPAKTKLGNEGRLPPVQAE